MLSAFNHDAHSWLFSALAFFIVCSAEFFSIEWKVIIERQKKNEHKKWRIQQTTTTKSEETNRMTDKGERRKDMKIRCDLMTYVRTEYRQCARVRFFSCCYSNIFNLLVDILYGKKSYWHNTMALHFLLLRWTVCCCRHFVSIRSYTA